jgi:hypothetical protein
MARAKIAWIARDNSVSVSLLMAGLVRLHNFGRRYSLHWRAGLLANCNQPGAVNIGNLP